MFIDRQRGFPYYFIRFQIVFGVCTFVRGVLILDDVLMSIQIN